MLEPVVARIAERQLLAGERRKREVGEVFEALDVDLGKLGQLLAVVVPVLVLIEPLDRHGRVELIEHPFVLHARERALLIEHRGFESDVDVGVGRKLP